MTEAVGPAVTILMADDDEDDRLLVEEAFEEAGLRNPLLFVKDGDELLRYLRREPPFTPETAPRPGLILLDLNMPRKDGREVLRTVKADPGLRTIPVVVLTTSEAEEDVQETYRLGVNSFITKPADFQGMVATIAALGRYWLQVVRLPGETE